MNIEKFVQELATILSEKGVEIGSKDNSESPS